MNILILRPKIDALKLMHKLKKIKIKSWIFPIFTFKKGNDLKKLKKTIISLPKNSAIIATSKHAIYFANQYLKKNKLIGQYLFFILL
ncbi:uroporphyrinogen-III synthase [Buchnera aphidicola (Thelaxes californica)]|uniref:Uroporphyrinogen-III synthase n=1 Tax=Buchnera aphidicola (Thelaxes californica) TaxID=1315998 RepID=A0A4D6YLX5_9GAMM|nr:uroporphyrinogen-III synthase [Buchnera aphidicola]QCI26974.1 uroporphyrinogen-III synthase [Buchnera aphidicola (Thelaxes californica)]